MYLVMSKNNSRNKKDTKSKYYLGISNVVLEVNIVSPGFAFEVPTNLMPLHISTFQESVG